MRLLIISLCLVAVVPAGTASAQPAGYVAVSGFADIRKFGSSTSESPYSSGTDFSFDATGAGGGFRIGTFLHPRWSLELGLDLATKETVDREDPVVILIFPPIPRPDFKSSTGFLTVGTTIGFHPAAKGRVRLGYRAGFSFVRGIYTSEYTNYAVPTDIFSGTGQTGLFLRGAPPTITTLTQRHNAGALTLGFDAAIDVTSRFALVPEIRALAFSTPGAGGGVFLIRPGIGVRWRF